MLRPWQTQFWLEESSGQSFHAKLSNQLMKDIQTGRLTSGMMMPGSRALAKQLGVNRKTVQLVYEELESQGWLVSKPRSGTFVADVLPEQALSAENQQLVHTVKAPRSSSTLLDNLYQSALVAEDRPGPNDGIPDARLIPYELLSRAYRRALVQSSRGACMGYGDPRGSLELRRSIQKMLTMDRFMNVSTEQVCIVRGSQMGIYLASRILNPDKGVIVLEKFCYPPAMAAFESNGFTVIRCELDHQGIDTDALQSILETHQVAAIYTTPHHQYPTTVSMTMERRLKLLQLSKVHRFAIIEDDYDHEFHYEGRPIPPLSSLPDSENVIHIGSMSKVFAPGLRLGYLVADEEFVDRVAQEIILIDRQGNTMTELAVADLMTSGDVKKHIRKTRKLYQSRRDFAASEFKKVFGDSISFILPAGGMALWVNVTQLVDVDKLEAFQHPDSSLGSVFSCEQTAVTHMRFGFGALNEQEISISVEKLYEALH